MKRHREREREREREDNIYTYRSSLKVALPESFFQDVSKGVWRKAVLKF